MNSLTLGSDATAWIVSALIASSVAVAALVCVALLVSRILKPPGARSAVWTATLLWILASPVAWLLLASRPPAAPALPLGSDRPGEHDGLVPLRVYLLANLTSPDAPGVAEHQAAKVGIHADAGSTVATSAAPDRPVGSAWPFEWPQTLVAVYLLGVSIALLRSLWAWGRSATLRRAANPLDETDPARRVAAWGERLSLRRAPSLRSSNRIDVPCLAGTRRPVILLPTAFFGPADSSRCTIEQESQSGWKQSARAALKGSRAENPLSACPVCCCPRSMTIWGRKFVFQPRVRTPRPRSSGSADC